MWPPRRGAPALALLVACGCFVDLAPGLSGAPDPTGPDSTTAATSGETDSAESTATSGGTGGDEGGQAGCPTTMPPGTWYIDQDGDSWGAGPGQVACDRPPGTSPERGDCDDDDPERYPGALEVCDGEDDDCDEIVDEYSSVNESCGGCRLAERGGVPYWFCAADGIDWASAHAACVARGWTVELLSVHDEAERAWAHEQAQALFASEGLKTFWIGLHRADDFWQGCDVGLEQWVWSDGSPVDYTAWSMGQPDNAGMACDSTCTPLDAFDAECPRENCGHMLYAEGGWNDRACSAAGVGYACRAAAPP